MIWPLGRCRSGDVPATSCQLPHHKKANKQFCEKPERLSTWRDEKIASEFAGLPTLVTSLQRTTLRAVSTSRLSGSRPPSPRPCQLHRPPVQPELGVDEGSEAQGRAFKARHTAQLAERLVLILLNFVANQIKPSPSPLQPTLPAAERPLRSCDVEVTWA